MNSLQGRTRLGAKLVFTALVAIGVLTIGSRAIEAATELARVNNTVISLEDFNKKYQENLKFFQFKAPTRKGVLDDLIKRELGVQEAKRLGLDKDPEVQDRMNTVLYHALLDKELAKQFEEIHVTDDDAKAFYTKNPEIRTSHIFVSVAPNAKAEDEKKALEKITKIQNEYLKPGKMSFSEVAQKYSEGVAAPMGGDIDYQTREKLDPRYYDTALALKSPGKVSGIVRTQFGYHIIKLTAVRSWDDADKPAVKRAVFEQRRNQIFDTYMASLRQKNKVTVKADLLKE